MHRLLVLWNDPDDREAFRRHYEETHGPLARKMPGIRSYTVGFDVQMPGGTSPYFCVAQLDFDDEDAMNAALASPEGQAAVADGGFAPKGAVSTHFEVHEI
jgi:uncharacterized protein (TIGR02118 family)